MIIGGTGSLGQHLLSLFRQDKSIVLIVVSRDENKQWLLRSLFPTVHFVLGDIRDGKRMADLLAMWKPTHVILAAALKHIDQCEAMLSESIKTNIHGIQNVTDACVRAPGVQKMLLISTDKACSPVNVYGMCKAIAERIVTNTASSYNKEKQDKLPDFLCVRYGNVLNSRGSLIPKFAEIGKSATAKTFPITDASMTRFFMTLDQSVDLIAHALVFGSTGETWIPEVPAIKILDLAKYFSVRYNKPYEIVGKRPGEKLHECLINECEIERTQLISIDTTHFYVVKPSLHLEIQAKPCLTQQYESSKIVDFSTLLPIIESILAAT